MVSRQPDTYLPVDPVSLLDLATELAGRARPSDIRTAADRAYYAAFLTTRDQLIRKNYARFTDDGRAHRRVRVALRAIDQDMGSFLNALRVTRNALTYETGPVTLPGGRTLSWMLGTARNLIDFVNALPVRA